jgi:hypothetical protein
MATTKTSWAAAVQNTITLNSLLNGNARQGNVIDFTSVQPVDSFIGGSFKTTSGSLGANPILNIYVCAITDGTNYGGTSGTSTVGGGDALITLPSNTGNFLLLAQVSVQVAAAAEYFQPRSVAAIFGGYLPPKIVVVVLNNTGLTLDSSAGGQIWHTDVNLVVA